MTVAMESIRLINEDHIEVAYTPSKSMMLMKLKGIVEKKHLENLRDKVASFFSTFEIEKLIMNTKDSEYQEFDFADNTRKAFYKIAEQNGVKKFTIEYPNRYFINQIKDQWSEFFSNNGINISVSARLDS